MFVLISSYDMAFKFLSEYGSEISDFNALVFMKRAREHYKGVTNPKDDTDKRYHQRRLSCYHDLFVRKLKPPNMVASDKLEMPSEYHEEVCKYSSKT